MKPNGQPNIVDFLLTAGHCNVLGDIEYRGVSEVAEDKNEVRIGFVDRTALPKTGTVPHETDGLAIRLNSPDLIPRYIYRGGKVSPKPINRAGRDVLNGETVCFFGVKTNRKRCGPIIGIYAYQHGNDPTDLYNLKVGGNFRTQDGDSGGPVWNEETGDVVGMVSNIYPDGRSGFAPLLPVLNYESSAPGVLRAPGMERKPGVPSELHLETVK